MIRLRSKGLISRRAAFLLLIGGVAFALYEMVLKTPNDPLAALIDDKPRESLFPCLFAAPEGF